MNFGGTARALRTAAAVLLSVCCTGAWAATLPAHPRLLLDEKSFAALRERAQDDPLVALGAEKLRANADLILKEPPLRHELGGKRMLGVVRRALMRLTHLALARRLFGEDRYRDAAVREMRNLAAFEDWNPGHFLDTAELALGYAIAYDWLHADLDDETRERAEQALRTHALEPSFSGNRKWTFWLQGSGNWGQVCHTGMIAAALALGPEKWHLFDETISRTRPAHQKNLDWYEPKGAYPVSPMYWSYETDFLSLASALQRGALGDDGGLSERPCFVATYAFANLVTGPSGLLFNVGDAKPERYCDFAPWYGAWRYGRRVSPQDVALYRAYCEARPDRLSLDEGERLFALTLVYVRQPQGDSASIPFVWSGEGPNGVVIQRRNPQDPSAPFVGLKAGKADFPHGHMDAGSFVFERDGVRWAWDAGTPSYLHYENRGIDLGDRKRGGARWKAFHYNVHSHNTLTIDGGEQDPRGVAAVTVLSEKPESSVCLDLTPCYAPDAKRVRRLSRFLADGRRWCLSDRLEGVRPGATVRWSMLTRAKVWIAGDGCAVLTQEGKRLVIEPRGVARGAAWSVVRNPCPNPDIDPPMKGMNQISLCLTVPESGSVSYEMLFR